MPKDAWVAIGESPDATAGVEAQIVALSRFSAMMFPALLALESLMGLTLGWAVYQRLSSEPAGPIPSARDSFWPRQLHRRLNPRHRLLGHFRSRSFLRRRS